MKPFTPEHRRELSRAQRKRFSRPLLSGEDLEAFRRDPARERTLGLTDRVICRECGKAMRKIVKPHLDIHKLTAQQYRAKWGDPPLYPPDWLKRHNRKSIQWRKANPGKALAISRKYLGAHREEMRKRAREHRRANKATINERVRKRYQEDLKYRKRELRQARVAYAANPEHYRQRNKKRTALLRAVRLAGITLDSLSRPNPSGGLPSGRPAKRGRGRPPSKTEEYKKAEALHVERPRLNWRQIANIVTPKDCAKDPRAAGEAIRVGVYKLRKERKQLQATP